ncbi:class I SAM-dependent methyltransferase [Terrarubrum flagellatum]|uniref:class I SAM-dependent methyltransferase n=1 Tax=Terrirubrum flagellatum TaxID=2895980 RepID=UPI003145662C
MSDQQIRFEDGAAYEEIMGKWSRLAGDVFLDWLAPAKGLSWIDVGCGNGAFTELAIERCAPSEITGVDPSEGQLAYARSRPGARGARFQPGDAMALSFDADRFDVAVMALVIFFVPDPAKGVAEMLRVTKPGGLVAAYAWDIPGGGFPLEPVQAEMRAAGLKPPRPPSFEISSIEPLRKLWSDAVLLDVDARAISVRRIFDDFDAFWRAMMMGSALRAAIEQMPPADAAALRERVRARLSTDGERRISYEARANAVRGRVPG